MAGDLADGAAARRVIHSHPRSYENPIRSSMLHLLRRVLDGRESTDN